MEEIMSTTVTITLVLVVVLVIAFIGVGIWFRKIAVTADDFLLAGRGAPFWLLATAYLGGAVGGASVSGYMNLGASQGISGMWTSLFLITGGSMFVIIFAKRLNYFGRKTKAITLGDFVCARYGEKLRLPIAIISFTRPGFLTGMQFLAIAVILNIVFGLDLKIGVVISAVIILLYLITAGQYSALVTQWFQSILQSVGILLFAIAAFKVLGSPTEAAAALPQILPPGAMNLWGIDFTMFSVWLLTFGLFYLVDPWTYMWSYMGKTPRTTSNGMLAINGGSYFNVLPFVSGMAIAAAAMSQKFAMPEGASGDAIYAWFTIEHMPTTIGVIVLVGLLMTIISCGSSFAMNGVTTLTRDVYQKLINKNATDKQTLFASRISLVVVVALGIAAALWLPTLVPLWSLAQAIGISGLFMVVMSAWFWKRSTTAGALASTIGGGVASLGWAAHAWLNGPNGSPGDLMPLFGGVPLHAAHVGLMVAIPLMIIVSLCTKPDYEAAKATSYKLLGQAMQDDPDNAEKQTRRGFFGWFGADTFGWRAFWIIIFAVFFLHYILAFFFHIPAIVTVMIWTALIVSGLMIVLFTIMGGRDLGAMISDSRKGKKLSS
jgi:SSS family solute:Na+ symporter